MLKVTLLIACVLILLASILYTFFWNRLFGTILGLLVRLVLWNAGSSSAWVDIGVSELRIQPNCLLTPLKVQSMYHSWLGGF